VAHISGFGNFYARTLLFVIGWIAFQAAVLAINSADDERNPPETGIMDREIRRLKNGATSFPQAARRRGTGLRTRRSGARSSWGSSCRRLRGTGVARGEPRKRLGTIGIAEVGRRGPVRLELRITESSQRSACRIGCCRCRRALASTLLDARSFAIEVIAQQVVIFVEKNGQSGAHGLTVALTISAHGCLGPFAKGHDLSTRAARFAPPCRTAGADIAERRSPALTRRRKMPN
jgi:hypothetical protein